MRRPIGTALVVPVLVLAFSAQELAGPPDDADNPLWMFGYSVASGHGLDAYVTTVPQQAVNHGLNGPGHGAACVGPNIKGPDCD